MKHIKNYKLYENTTKLTQEQIDFLDECGGKWVFDESTGLVNCGYFIAEYEKLTDFKGIRFAFSNITTYFIIFRFK